MAVSSRSNDSPLARNGTLSSNAAWKVRRTMPTNDRCHPPSTFTRAAYPPSPLPCPRRSPEAPVSPPGARPAPRRDAARATPAGTGRPRPPPSPCAAHPRSLPGPRGAAPPASPLWRGFSSPTRGQRALREQRRRRDPPGRGRLPSRPSVRPRRRSLPRLHIVRSRHRRCSRRGVRVERRFHEPVGRGTRVPHLQLLEEERERLFEIGADGPAHVRRQIPELLLEGPDRLLPALVDELFFGVALLPLLLTLRLHPRVHLGAQRGREPGMIEHHGLEVRGEVDLDRFAQREVAEGVGRQGGGAMLYRAPQAVGGTRFLRERLQGGEIELDFRDGAVGQHDAPMAGAGLHGNLADAVLHAQAMARALVPTHERLELVHVRILPAHFSDLGADRHGNALRLALPDVLRQLGGALVVRPLLLVEGGLGEIDQGG